MPVLTKFQVGDLVEFLGLADTHVQLFPEINKVRIGERGRVVCTTGMSEVTWEESKSRHFHFDHELKKISVLELLAEQAE